MPIDSSSQSFPCTRALQRHTDDFDTDVRTCFRASAHFAFQFTRRQFPVRLAFALTINKAQGQSVKYVGIDLRVPVFAHGQLYVALSRATTRRNIRVLLSSEASLNTNTKNVVYPEKSASGYYCQKCLGILECSPVISTISAGYESTTYSNVLPSSSTHWLKPSMPDINATTNPFRA
ncbi:hypothetical protein BD779DRAFT_536572 [Infundibulicybe gibba]|nr:hypothetical protein BD779DRAFT_536572 [Infundibulicybe gibba]